MVSVNEDPVPVCSRKRCYFKVMELGLVLEYSIVRKSLL